jgi:hypothetical protein
VAATLSVRVPAGSLTGEPRFPAWRVAAPEGAPEAAHDGVPAAGGRRGEGGPAPAGGGEAWGEAEVVAVGPLEREERDGAVTYRQRLVLAAFAPGRAALPPVGVAIPLAGGTVEARTPAGLALAVASVLPPPAAGGAAGAAADRPAAEPAPRPPAPPRPLPLGARFWWTAGVAAATCLLALAGAYRRLRSAAEPAGGGADDEPDLPPYAELVAALEVARRSPSPPAGHALLSRALRRYLGRTLRFPAPESSTSEIHRALAGRPLPPGVSRRTVDLLRACDLVKFARAAAGVEALAARLSTALGAAGEIEAHLRPPAAAESAGPGRSRKAAA